MRFKSVRLMTIRNGSQRTILANYGLELLHVQINSSLKHMISVTKLKYESLDIISLHDRQRFLNFKRISRISTMIRYDMFLL